MNTTVQKYITLEAQLPSFSQCALLAAKIPQLSPVCFLASLAITQLSGDMLQNGISHKYVRLHQFARGLTHPVREERNFASTRENNESTAASRPRQTPKSPTSAHCVRKYVFALRHCAAIFGLCSERHRSVLMCHIFNVIKFFVKCAALPYSNCHFTTYCDNRESLMKSPHVGPLSL